MKYYVIYLKSGIVVQICSYDDEEMRNNIYKSWIHRDQYRCFISDYDDVQCLNEVI